MFMFEPTIRSQFVTISEPVDTGGPTGFLQNVSGQVRWLPEGSSIRLWLRYLSVSSVSADIGTWVFDFVNTVQGARRTSRLLKKDMCMGADSLS